MEFAFRLHLTLLDLNEEKARSSNLEKEKNKLADELSNVKRELALTVEKSQSQLNMITEKLSESQKLKDKLTEENTQLKESMDLLKRQEQVCHLTS